jgi:hypothetical protein
MGALQNLSKDILFERTRDFKSKEIMEKSTIRKLGKEEAKKILESIEKRQKEMLSKGGRRMKVKFTDQDMEEIKTLLIPMIAPFRVRIRHEDTLKKISKQKVVKK